MGANETMSGQTHGGKGDRDRTDRTKFEHNWDKIFGGNNEQAYSDPVEELDIDRKLKEWGMMYDCLQNIHLYEYPVEEVKQLLKRIKV